MICPQCKTRNPIGNKFCRECGTQLHGEAGILAAEEAVSLEAERKQERAAALLAEAFAFSEQDKPDAALPLAEQAASLLPSSTSAQALLAALYERTEQTDKAIEVMERVVALNPDSVADREKLLQLRRGVHVLPVRPGDKRVHTPAQRPRRPLPAWFPLTAAAASISVVLGAGLYLLHTGADRPDPQVRVGAAAPSPAAPGPAAPGPAENLRAAPAPPGSVDPFEPTMGRPPSPAPPAPRAAGQRADAAPDSFVPAQRPTPTQNTRSSERRAPGALPTITPRSVTPAPAERIVVRPPAGDQARRAGSEPPPGSGYIRIRVGPPAPGTPAGAGSSARTVRAATAPARSAADDPASFTDPLLRAQAFQADGRYREAVAAYQEALPALSGAAAGEAYQGIALSQQRLGNEEAARNAYRQAIAAYEAQGASGRDADAAQRGIASCRAALEVLGG